jgi:predicted transcriptional regulator
VRRNRKPIPHANLELDSLAKGRQVQENDIIISIRPEHANNIMAGRKTVELRRRFPANSLAGGLMFIYASSPDQALIGAARIERVRRMTPAGLWRSFKKQACMSRELFNTYFAGATEGFGVMLGEVVRFPEAIPVSELKERFRFSPPQSYRYLRGSLTSLLNDDRIQIPDRHQYRDRSGGQPPSRRRAN